MKLKYIELNEDKSPKDGKRNVFHTSFDNLENAGLQLNNNVVVVDFDNDNTNEKEIIEYFKTNYPTLTVKTEKGIHFYYSKPKGIKIKNLSDTITVGGFQVDYKTGNQYVMIKQYGIAREPSEDLRLDNLPPLPPLMYQLEKQKDNLSGMKDHDGRNPAIFNHLRFVRNTYATIDIDSIAKTINEVIFAEPLPNTELEAVISSSENYINSDENNVNIENMIEFAELLIEELDIKIYNTKLYFLNDNRYVSNDRLLLKKANEVTKLKRAFDSELMYQIDKFANEINTERKSLPITIKNGIITDGEFSENNNPVFSPFYLDVTFDTKSYNEDVDKFLNSITCNRKELRQTLEEILGHILLTTKFPHHVFFLSGGGYNGKSTFLEMINSFVGDLGHNLSLEAFNDNTSIASLNGKLSNCSDETDDIYIERCKRYKSLASGNTIRVRTVYSKELVPIQNTATLILSANKMPNFKDKTEGFYRRLFIIPFDFVITEKISDLDNLLSTDNAKSYILNLALNGVKSIKSNGYKMSMNDYINEKLNEYKMETDTVTSFLNDYPNIEDKKTKMVHLDYMLHCEEVTGKEPLGLAKFSSRLKDFGYITKVTNENGKSIRIYKKIE